jgi:hypothetical protein
VVWTKWCMCTHDYITVLVQLWELSLLFISLFPVLLIMNCY